MLKKLSERLNERGAHSVVQLPDTQFGDQSATRIEARTIEQTTRIQKGHRAVGTLARRVAAKEEKVCFSSDLRQGKPYPLFSQGFCVRESIATNTWQGHAILIAHGYECGQIRELEQSLIRMHTHTIRVREQSMSALSLRPQSRSQTVCIRELITVSTVRE